MLLDTRICDLNINLRHTWVQGLIRRLYQELERKNIVFRPHIWISDDWFSPDGVPGFAIPFYLLHPSLASLEKEMIGYVEGGDVDWCMRLMRHETGHAIDNAYHLRKIKTRQSLFGLTSMEYPTSYLPDRRSRNFVRHLEDYYAQAHPDEDWAETFAVWLTPRSCWRRKYASWGAIKKLELMDQIMTNIQDKQPIIARKSRVGNFTQNTLTLREYYRQKRRRLKLEQSPFKRDMKKIFSKEGKIPAWKFINSESKEIINKVTIETNIEERKIKKILTTLKKTCRKEDLKFSSDSIKDSDKYSELMVSFITSNIKKLTRKKDSRIIM